MKKFFAYILLCINIIFGIGISAKHVISNIKSNHDYSYNKQITIKFDFKKKDEIRENIEYIEKKLIENNEFNYKISYFEDGIINIFLVKNNKNFNKVSDLLDDKKIELCYIENGKNGENIEKSILMDDSWKTNIETQNEEKKIIISIPKNEIDNVYNLYLKSFNYETEKIERILKSDFSKTNVLETKKQKNFFIRIRFKFKNKTKKIILHHEIFYEKNGEKNKFKIIFPSENNKKIYNEYKQEEDIDYYQKILNSNDKKNYKIIDINNINKPLNKLNKTFFILIVTFIISFLTLVFIYRFNSIAIITAVILQLFLTIFSFLITKQFFNTKAFFGLIIISLMSLLTYSMQNIFFYRKMENGDNSKNASLEAYQKTKPIIFTVSIFYLILCLTIYFFTNKNEDFLGITNIFFINAIINFFIHLVFNKLTWLINNSSITKKRYEIFSQFKNNQKEEFLSEDYEFSLKKEKKIFFIFITTFLFFLTLTFNFKFFFKEDIFKHKNFTDNIRITLKNHNKSIPYLLNFINEIKINNHVINFDKNIKQFNYSDNNDEYNCYIININEEISENRSYLEKKLKDIEKKIDGEIKLEKEYFYNNSKFDINYQIVMPISIEILFLLCLLIMKYKFSQILCTFFISTITFLIPIIFISFSRVFVESSLILFSTLICILFSFVTCLNIMKENKNNLNSIFKKKIDLNNFNVTNENIILSKTLKSNWEFIGKNLIIVNCFFLMISFLEKFTIILFSSLIGLLFLIFMIKNFFILFSNQFELVNKLINNKLKKMIMKLVKKFKKNKILENKNILKEEIFKGINEYRN